MKRKIHAWGAIGVMAAAMLQASASRAQTLAMADLSQLSIEQLADVVVTSVAKRPELLLKAPAAIYVVGSEDIRRAGAVSIPEALRLVPNLQVAQMDAGSYAIAARGFNHQTGTSNKLLTLIDGRTVYTPLFSGVFWDSQDVTMQDVDRIEVIRGPGGTLWGSNAVNGVINVVTRSAKDTQGGMASAGTGTTETDFSARYGGMLNDQTAFRVYAKGFQRGPNVTPSGADAPDQWDGRQGGFRSDWSGDGATATLQGDIYDNKGDEAPKGSPDADESGGNILGRWTQNLADGSALEFQAYFDRARRSTTSDIVAAVNTYDVSAQYSFALGDRQHFVTGVGYRSNHDRFTPGPRTAFLDPAQRTTELSNVFIQDDIALTSALTVTAGLKLEDNSYTGLEYLPDARLAWQLSDRELLWAAISRAVRTPSRFDTDLYNTGVFAGGPDFKSETLTAYEGGYRAQLSPDLIVSLATYYSVYKDLRTVEASTARIFPLVVKNGMEGSTYGFEFWTNYMPTSWWSLGGGLSTLHKDLRIKPGSRDIFGANFAGNDPDFQWSLRSTMNVYPKIELDMTLRGVSELPSPKIPAYVEAGLRLGWHATDQLEFSIAGYNLLHDQHLEFYNPSVPRTEIPRSVYVNAVWSF